MQAGYQTIQLITPDAESTDRLGEDQCVFEASVRTLILLDLFGAMGGRVLAAVVRLIHSMRRGGCSLDFFGLTGTILSDEAASLLAGALDTLPARNPAAKAKTVEILSKQAQC